MGLETEPLGVPVTLTLPLPPLNDAVSRVPVPLNVGVDTVPAGVPFAETVPAVPVNAPVSLAPVPVKLGCEDVADVMPVTTVVFEPLVGSVPCENAIVKFSFATVQVSVGRVPTFVMLFTVPVLGVTVIVGVDTVPAGV